MFGRTIAMRMRATRVSLGCSPYAVFLRSTKGMYGGLKAVQRSRLVAKKWGALPAAEKAKFVATAKKTTFKRKPKPPKKKRSAGPFAKFVKANYKSVANLPFKQRLRTLAKQWQAKKKQ